MAAVARALPRLAGFASGTSNHTSGIYADMSIDGPEIGTLVVVVDRAKNLPNLRTMGKQDPYCAARLGKEAKKTDTDRRGGQTPRWDQELRFIVHESPDYHKIKVSVFNDDKRKTDLIGETWIGLEELLRPGGGQGDSWHTLNVKGRYAGEIRIELTFYDSRPKVDKPRERKQSTASSSQSEQRSAMLGPRQLAGGRPLPTDPATPGPPYSVSLEHTGSVTVPQNVSRSYRTPPHQAPALDPLSSHGQYAEQAQYEQNGFGTPEDYARPLPVPGASQHYTDSYEAPRRSVLYTELEAHEQQHEHNQQPNDYMQFTDDPYALQVVEAQQNLSQDAQPRSQPTPPRHDRVQMLSGSPHPRPLPPIELLHTHSAPQLAPQEHSPGPHSPTNYDYDQEYTSSTINDRGHEQHQGRSWSSPSQFLQDQRQGNSSEEYDAPPPPPPVHRNSAPSVPQTVPRAAAVHQLSTPTRALHVATAADDLHHGFERSASEPVHHQSPNGHGHPPRRQDSADGWSTPNGPSHNAFQHHLSLSADTNIRPRDEMACDPRLQTLDRRQEPGTNMPQGRPLSYQTPPPYQGQTRTRPLSYHDDPRQQYKEQAPIINPLSLSTGASSQPPTQKHYQTPRKSISPHPTPGQSKSNTPYSPDSFNSLNPSHSQLSTPDTANKFEPTPMYSPHNTPPPTSSHQTEPATSAGQGQATSNSPSAIIGSDGRLKDPTDHLPPSSYAPEPERKGNRPSTVINIKNRFGPRNARLNSSAPSSPISPGGGNASSPLAPTHSSLLNTHMNMNGGYNLNSPYPPPIPGKIPLGGYQSQINEPDHFEMARLSLQLDDGYEQPDIGGPKTSAAGRALLSQHRVRKSRWGA